MDLEIIGISVLWLFLFGYIIIASIDFGAGFFSAYSELTKTRHILHHIIQRYLSPVWEVTNVFLVFFFVGMVGFFPSSAYYYGTVLLVPVSIGIVLIAIRGSYYAFQTYGAKDSKLYIFLYGVAGLLIPASLSIVLTVSEGGFVDIVNDQPVLLYEELFFSPLTWSIVILSIVSVLYISATFLTAYADVAKDEAAKNLLRKYALAWSGPTALAAGLIVLQMRAHNIERFENIMDLWWIFALSGVFFVITVALLLMRKYYSTAFWSLVIQFALAFFGYGISHYPYLMYPYLTIYDGFTNEAMATALIVAFIAGFALLIPSLFLLARLFLFNKKYVKGGK
ncbi:cytochrome D ubiquinol oxidase subunit II [Halalkalibacillus sediminis]|uniref:Cytochrome D ubiquinol oxidase subunit II n=1 Tax=Halalkalibacillus sediminis TaxID=2018042 RepID=A0A2I0QVQ4_9BACI|nr:cytochrome d ubiquinol oxidase subunit II [Halalkalibacillus sediminis]PKR78408.1 cytochrome D ubiquinol oxidase subunit II [Halalkalibacillus sediminis]